MLTEKTLKYMAGLGVLFGSFLVINSVVPGVGTALAVGTLILIAIKGTWFTDSIVSLFSWAGSH